MRCKHGEEPGPPSPPDAPLVKHKKEPLGWSSPDLRKELRRRGVDAEGGGARELAARLEEHLEEHGVRGWRNDPLHTQRPRWCKWRGRVSNFSGHLQSCGFEPVPCRNAAAGCTESVLRQDAARACLLCAHGEEGPPADGGCLLS